MLSLGESDGLKGGGCFVLRLVASSVAEIFGFVGGRVLQGC